MFAGYVSEIARHFAKDVPYWITFNEPNLLMGGYLKQTDSQPVLIP